jgi:hypothetical protein
MLNPTQLTQLYTELSTDPEHMGYTNIGDDIGNANLLNSLTSPGAATITLSSINNQAFFEQLLLSNLNSNIAATVANAATATSTTTSTTTTAAMPTATQASNNLQANWPYILQLLVAQQLSIANDSTFQQLATAATNAGILTSDQITALTSRTGSRAEVLFGQGTVVQPIDVAQAWRIG